MGKVRIDLWDNYKGVLILLVVLGHMLYGYAFKIDDGVVRNLVVSIYAFHMPAFVFCSGYLSKSEHARSGEALVKMLLYYAVFNTAMMLFLFFTEERELSLLTPYNSYWYLLSLTCWRFVAKSLARIKFIIPLSIAVSLLLGWWPEFSNVLSIRRTIGFLPFFMAGYLINDSIVSNYLAKRKHWHMVCGLICFVLCMLICWTASSELGITKGMLLYESYDKNRDVLVRAFLMGIAFFAIMSLFVLLPNRKIPYLTTMGRNSLSIYVLHRYIPFLFMAALPVANYSPQYIGIACIVTIATTTLLGNSKLNVRMNAVFTDTCSLLCGDSARAKIIRFALACAFVAILCMKPVMELLS